MRNSIAAAAIVCAAFTGPVASASAGSDSPVSPSASQTVNQLRAQGYTVIIESSGDTPLDRCTAYTVRPGQRYSRMDSGFPGAGDDLITSVISMTIYVHTDC